jgi:bacterioferritin-associated ferredoxin
MPKTILCHCEDVEIDELYSALAQGYGDIETLKRYTGIGTGKCQGKCCFLQTLRVLAVLKSGAAGAGGTDLESRASGTGRPPQLTGDADAIRIPTVRPPVLPLRIDDIVDGEGERS